MAAPSKPLVNQRHRIVAPPLQLQKINPINVITIKDEDDSPPKTPNKRPYNTRNSSPSNKKYQEEEKKGPNKIQKRQ